MPGLQREGFYMKKEKLFAYSDGDGFIHWNVIEVGSIWNKDTGEWMPREKRFEASQEVNIEVESSMKALKREYMLRIALLGAWTAFFLALFLQGKL
jgi:hypothetical protein